MGLIYSVEDMLADPQYQARQLFEEVDIGRRKLKIPAILPKLEGTPGYTSWPGPSVGEHRDAVLADVGYSEAEIAALVADGDA